MLSVCPDSGTRVHNVGPDGRCVYCQAEDTGDSVLGYEVRGRVTVWDDDGEAICQVVLCRRGDVHMTVTVALGAAVGAPLTSTSLSEVLAGFAIRCGVPHKRIHQSL